MARSKMFPVEGCTYPVRNEIAALGGKWDARRKVWMVPEAALDEVYMLVLKATIEDQDKKAAGAASYGFLHLHL